MVIQRTIQAEIEKRLFKGKVIVIYGARRVGKTTLITQIQKKYEHGSAYLNCDEPDIAIRLSGVTSTEMKSLFGNKKLVFLDEAQRVRDIGLTLKLLVDNFPEIQIIATGSSAFDLSNKVIEPLTGRKYEFSLYPFSWEELRQVYSKLERTRLLEKRLIFGMYPEVVTDEGSEEEILREVRKGYLYRDVLQFQDVKNPEILEKLLQALALQVGNEVSYNELATSLEIDKRTVARYIQILESAFVIFRLRPLSRNPRKEIFKLRKVYFYDTGVRNALINNFNPVGLHADIGGLWENFLVSERIKVNHNHTKFPNIYFWRNYKKQEIDYIEEEGGILRGFEFKWGKGKLKIPRAFASSYKNSRVNLISRENFDRFLRIAA